MAHQPRKDIWYDIDSETDVDKLLYLMGVNLNEYILPFLNRFEKTNDIWNELPTNAYLERLILLSRTNQQLRAKTLLDDAMEKIRYVPEKTLLVAKAQSLRCRGSN